MSSHLLVLAGALFIGVLSGVLSVFGYSVLTPAIEGSVGLQASPSALCACFWCPTSSVPSVAADLTM